MMEEDPTLEVIPTRWVDVNKAEPEEEPQYKSRLVVRGDLEDPSRMRTDSPTGPDYAEHGSMPGYIPRNHFALGRHLSSFSAGQQAGSGADSLIAQGRHSTCGPERGGEVLCG